jgi:hypothetical protein
MAVATAQKGPDFPRLILAIMWTKVYTVYNSQGGYLDNIRQKIWIIITKDSEAWPERD